MEQTDEKLDSSPISNNRVPRYKVRIGLLLIIVIGALVRFHNLGNKSLWTDEFESVQIAAGHTEPRSNRVNYSPLAIIPRLQGDVDVPFYYMLLNLWIRIFGNSAAALRALSTLFGLGGIWLIYLVGRALLDERAGLIGAFILALSPLHVYYAQEARGYALQVFLILLSTYFFIKIGFYEGSKWTLWFGYLLPAVLAIYTHYFSAFIFLFHNAFLLLCRRDLLFRWRWILSQATLALAWLLPFLTLFHVESFGWIEKRPPLESHWPLAAFPFVLSKFTFSDYAMQLLSFSRWIFALGVLLFGGLFLFGVAALLRKHGREKTLFVFIWLCVPILALLAIDMVKQTTAVTSSRYLITASCAYFILLASGIAAIGNPYLKVSALAGVALFFSLGLSQLYSSPKWEQWKEAAQYMDQISPPADLVAFYPGRLDFIHYYSERRIPEEIIPYGQVGELDNIPKDLNSILLVIKTSSPRTDSAEVTKIGSVLSAYYRLAEVRVWKGVKIVRFAKR